MTSVFDDIRANLGNLEIDEIRRRLEPVFKGMVVKSPILDSGTYLYRARQLGSRFNKSLGMRRSDLVYPPADQARLNRANRPNQPMFYCSAGKEALFFELQDLMAGEEIILTFWQATEPLIVNNIGYTQAVFQELGARRTFPSWTGTSQATATVTLPTVEPAEVAALLSSDPNRAVRELLSKHFARPIAAGESEHYKITVAIAEAHLGTLDGGARRFGGLLYPSIRMWANADNLALLPWFVDAHLRFLKAVHFRIDSRTDTTFNITAIDAAHEFDAHGQLRWLGRILAWTLAPGQQAKFTVVEGRDPYGDYETGADGTPLHYIATDAASGDNIEMS